MMPALLLAAGLGTRLRPLTDTVPKCLAPIRGRPLLDWWLTACGQAGMRPIIINTHHHAARVEAFVNESPWRDRIVLAHEESLLGTGGTLLRHEAILGNGSFFVAHADNLSLFDMRAFVAAHVARPRDCVLTMMLFRTPTPRSCGIVTTNRAGRVIAFHEKVADPPDNLANGAVYIMTPEVFPLLRDCGAARPDISMDLLPRCLGRMATFFNSDYHRDIGTCESYAQAQKDMEERFGRPVESKA